MNFVVVIIIIMMMMMMMVGDGDEMQNKTSEHFILNQSIKYMTKYKISR